MTLQGHAADIKRAVSIIGYEDKPTNQTDMIFVGLGIFIGTLIGAITIHLGGIPVSLSTSGGALIAGLVLGWLRSKHPTFGKIPNSSLWILNNMGLNMFIAVIGIESGHVAHGTIVRTGNTAGRMDAVRGWYNSYHSAIAARHMDR